MLYLRIQKEYLHYYFIASQRHLHKDKGNRVDEDKALLTFERCCLGLGRDPGEEGVVAGQRALTKHLPNQRFNHSNQLIPLKSFNQSNIGYISLIINKSTY